MTFPWVAERVAAGKLVLHGWWFNLKEGQLYAFNPDTAVFDAVTGLDVIPTVQKGTRLSAIKPERLLLALANKKPAF
jgi:carbonic anhydrase